MKIKRTVLSRLVAILSIAVLCTGALFFNGCLSLMLVDYGLSEKDFKAYHDKEIYIQQRYHDKDEFGEQVYAAGARVDDFMPKYEEIEYNYYDIDFYIFDGVVTYTRTAITFALDLMFSVKDEYESAKQNELSTRSFMTEYEGKETYENPVFEFTFGTFSCKTVKHIEYPRGVRFICLDDSNYVLRYLIFVEWYDDEVKDVEYIMSYTNCPWNN